MRANFAANFGGHFVDILVLADIFLSFFVIWIFIFGKNGQKMSFCPKNVLKMSAAKTRINTGFAGF